MRALFLILITAAAASAGTASLRSFLQFCPSTDNSLCQQTLGTTSATGSQTFTQFGNFSGSATAASAYGLQSGSAALTLGNYQPGSLSDGNVSIHAADGDSFVTDFLTITGGVGSGILHLIWQASGSRDDGGSSLPQGAYSHLTIGAGGNYQEQSIPIGTGVLEYDFAVDFGTEFQLTSDLYTGFYFNDMEAAFYPLYNYSGTAQSTVRLTSAVVRDQNGDPVSGITMISASGLNYSSPMDGVAAPEPGTWALAAIGIVAVVARRRVS